MTVILISTLIFSSASVARVGMVNDNPWAIGAAMFTVFCAGFIYGRSTLERSR